MGARPDLFRRRSDRALKPARAGIELKPQSSRAYHLLFTVLFLRGEKEAGIARRGARIALNRTTCSPWRNMAAG